MPRCSSQSRCRRPRSSASVSLRAASRCGWSRSRSRRRATAKGASTRSRPTGGRWTSGRSSLIATPGTHHFVVWDYLGQDQNPADFWTGIAYATACTGLGPQDGSLNTGNLFGMLSGRSLFQFPAGVAVRLERHANVYANLHYHNYGDTTVHTGAVFNFIPARKGTVKHHAQAFTVGTIQIDIPANGSASVSGEWHAPTDLNIVSVSTHQHRRGTDILVHKVDAAGNDMGPLVDSPHWEHPTVRWYDRGVAAASRRRIPFYVLLAEPRRSSRPLRRHERGRDVLRHGLLLSRRRWRQGDGAAAAFRKGQASSASFRRSPERSGRRRRTRPRFCRRTRSASAFFSRSPPRTRHLGGPEFSAPPTRRRWGRAANAGTTRLL